MEARVTDAELLGLAERSWTSMASIVGQEMEGGKVDQEVLPLMLHLPLMTGQHHLATIPHATHK